MRHKCHKSCEEYRICDKRHKGRWCPYSSDDDPTLPGLTHDEYVEFMTLGHMPLGEITEEQHQRYMSLVFKTIDGLKTLVEQNDDE